MFMAQDALEPRAAYRFRGFSEPGSAETQEALFTGYEGYSEVKEKALWDEFWAGNRLIEVKRKNASASDEEVISSFRHGAMQDAESVFWIMALFFFRMVPEGKTFSSEELEELRRKRGSPIGSLKQRTIGSDSVDFFHIKHRLGDCKVDERLQEIYASLGIISAYLHVPWYQVEATGPGERYEFHLHEVMQRLLWKNIVRLRNGGDPIRIDSMPLPVRIFSNFFTDFTRPMHGYTTSCTGSLPTLRLVSCVNVMCQIKLTESTSKNLKENAPDPNAPE